MRRDGVIHYRVLLKCTPTESVSCTSDTCMATTAFEMRSVLPDWISGLHGHEATCCTAGFNEEIRKEDGRRWEGGTYVSLSKSTGGTHNTTTSAAFGVFMLPWLFKREHGKMFLLLLHRFVLSSPDTQTSSAGI